MSAYNICIFKKKREIFRIIYWHLKSNRHLNTKSNGNKIYGHHPAERPTRPPKRGSPSVPLSYGRDGFEDPKECHPHVIQKKEADLKTRWWDREGPFSKNKNCFFCFRSRLDASRSQCSASKNHWAIQQEANFAEVLPGHLGLLGVTFKHSRLPAPETTKQAE